MEKEKASLTELLTWFAITGIILFTLWVSYNAINDTREGIKAPSTEIISFIWLMGLFIINMVLLIRGSGKKIATTMEIEEKTSLRGLLSWVAIVGNILFMLWMTYRRISESFKGTIYQQISYIGLMGLLIVITALILRSRRNKEAWITK